MNQYHAFQTNDHDADNANTLPRKELNDRSSQLITDLVYFNVVVLLGSTITSYILARRTMRPIENTHQAQIRFTAEASHELRTPLAAMRADTESVLIQKTKDPELLRITLEDNLRDILKIQKLTDHLLQMSQYKIQRLLKRESIELKKMTRETITQLKRQHPDDKINIRLTGKPIYIFGDSIAMQQLIIIILDNAIKYSEPGDPIRINIHEDAHHVYILISDRGVGISSEDLPHIFEHFYRSSNARNKENQASGYGLGLPLAKDIVDLYRGQITINTTENKGTEISVSLPSRTLKRS